MRTSRIAAAACLLLALPVVGVVQQVPHEATQPGGGIRQLQDLLKVQTQAIKELKTRVEQLEERVKKLEEERTPPAGTPR